MVKQTEELKDILQALDSLQTRVKDLSTDDTGETTLAHEVKTEAKTVTKPAPNASQAQPEVPADSAPVVTETLPQARGELSTDHMSLLRAGIDELNRLSKLKDFPEFFDRLAQRTGLRMVLLKRWTSGLQVFVERNIKMPADAKRKRKDGRAPIPCNKNDLFAAVGDEATVYCGPVPVKHFPLDLTLMLGRGSKDRQIIILPLPSQNHWNTFLYLDADRSGEKALAVAEVLAHFALSRMCLLNKGMRVTGGRVGTILKSEIFRRKEVAAKRAEGGIPADPTEPLNAPEQPSQVTETPAEQPYRPQAPMAPPEVEVDPFAVQEIEPKAKQKEPETIPLVPKKSLKDEAPTAAELPNNDLESGGEALTADAVLHHSGELPALPKAACHIMAVIEDPKTTATRLEKALAMDQTLTAKVLRIANSPFYGAVREIRTVSEAIVRLGFVSIRNWTVVTATKSVFLAPGAGSLYKKIWQQSVLSAMAGQLVAQHLRLGEPENIFIGGLMQNIGQLVLARSHPELFQQILTESEHSGRPYHEVEKQLLGFDHGELGALLIKEWNLSQDLEEAVRWHHRFEDEEAGNAKVAAMIALGEEIAECSGTDLESETPLAAEEATEEEDVELPPLSPVCRYLGVTHAKYELLKAEAAKLKIDPHFFN